MSLAARVDAYIPTTRDPDWAYSLFRTRAADDRPIDGPRPSLLGEFLAGVQQSHR